MVGERRWLAPFLASHHEIGMRSGSEPALSGTRTGLAGMPPLGGVYVRSAYMLGAEAPSNDNRWNELQQAPANDLRNRDRGQITVQIGLDRRVLKEHLASLDDAGGQLSSALHL